jgi:predicted MPP superfamily phosphohydrolase
LIPSSVARILRKLSRENAFYFFTSIGNYTGESAASLEEFVKKIGEVNAKSLEFHFYRGDFGKWVAEVLEDGELAEEIKNLKNLKPVGDALRDQLYLVVSKRFEKLKSEFRG